MTKKELKERVYAEIAPLCKQAHYVQFEYMKDIFAFYRLRDNLLSFILFDNKPGDFECGAYVLPLYMPTESLYLDYGNALRFMDRRHASKYALHTDMTEKEVAAHLQYIYVFLKKRVLPALNRVSTPRGFARHVLRDGFSDILFTSPVNRYTAAPFTWFYLGNTRKGRAYGGKALAEAPLFGQDFHPQREEILRQMMENPAAAPEILTQVYEDSMRNLQMISK